MIAFLVEECGANINATSVDYWEGKDSLQKLIDAVSPFVHNFKFDLLTQKEILYPQPCGVILERQMGNTEFSKLGSGQVSCTCDFFNQKGIFCDPLGCGFK